MQNDIPPTSSFERPVDRIDRPGYNGFWPLLLVMISVLIILVWELTVASQIRKNGEEVRVQQTRGVDQAKQVQASLEKLARDLVELSAKDDDAKAIVKKYGIALSSPAPAPAPTSSPAASPAK
jgi:hypothetical protein